MVDVCKQSHSFTKSILMLNLKLKSWMLSKLTSFQENPAKCVATGIWILELFLICIKTKPSKNPHFIKVSILKLKHTQFICLENFILKKLKIEKTKYLIKPTILCQLWDTNFTFYSTKKNSSWRKIIEETVYWKKISLIYIAYQLHYYRILQIITTYLNITKRSSYQNWIAT